MQCFIFLSELVSLPKTVKISHRFISAKVGWIKLPDLLIDTQIQGKEKDIEKTAA